ncbi:Zn-ribbon domain-containing OB-fold protein [Natronobiforma cellulositropha]|uniref:Zn-ribbon domain-containing OB-fold protein n=1 Tax=Natronobiforma cellulositropha TaxID=1679076 RepID=UPI0021D5FADE|nr:Zn-ribbon domain-containing OB-fold protein [Natronobiforma cellulositropha]
MSDDPVGDAGFDDWLEAVTAGRAYYLECENGHGSLPPRRVCPEPGCGSTVLEERPLPETGELETYTVTTVATPAFADDAPYAIAIADFGPVRITGQVVDVDPAEVETGQRVALTVRTAGTTGDRVVALEVVGD